MPRQWTPKQDKLVDLYESTSPYILAYGATGSGKTAASTAGFINWTLHFSSMTFGLVAKTGLQTVENVLPNCLQFCEEHGIPYAKLNAKSYRIGWNRFLLLDGANIGAANRIRGLNLAGVFIDEVNTIHVQVMQELENRVRSADNGKIVLTANPDNPQGWFHRDYISKADKIGMDVVSLLWADNPSLHESVKERIRRTSTGAMYKRRVLGIAAPLHGLIYPEHTIDTPPDYREAEYWYVSVDPADSSSTHALLIGEFENDFWVYDEFLWDARMEGQLEHRKQVEKIKEWVGDKHISYCIYDPASPNFGMLLEEILNVPTYGAVKDVFEGIRMTQANLAEGDIKISNKVEHTIRELNTYQWDEKASERGEDKPLKSNDHAMDALRYFCYFNHPQAYTGEIIRVR